MVDGFPPVDEEMRTYVMMRSLLALEQVTKNNRGLLCSLAADFELHQSLVTIVKSFDDKRGEERIQNIHKLSLKLINRLLLKKPYSEYHCV